MNRPGKEIIRAHLEKRSVGEISEILDVDETHIYNIERRGVSPTLHTALVDAGWIEDTRRCKANGWLRRAVWIHEDDLPLFDALLARHGDRTLQELVDNHMIHKRRLDDD